MAGSVVTIGTKPTLFESGNMVVDFMNSKANMVFASSHRERRYRMHISVLTLNGSLVIPLSGPTTVHIEGESKWEEGVSSEVYLPARYQAGPSNTTLHCQLTTGKYTSEADADLSCIFEVHVATTLTEAMLHIDIFSKQPDLLSSGETVATGAHATNATWIQMETNGDTAHSLRISFLKQISDGMSMTTMVALNQRDHTAVVDVTWKSSIGVATATTFKTGSSDENDNMPLRLAFNVRLKTVPVNIITKRSWIIVGVTIMACCGLVVVCVVYMRFDDWIAQRRETSAQEERKLGQVSMHSRYRRLPDHSESSEL